MVRDHRIETYSFPVGSIVGPAFTANTWRQVNGILLGVKIKANNYDPAGTLVLSDKVDGNVIWSLASGTATGNVAQSGVYYPLTPTVGPVNQTLSGTNSVGVWTEIPLIGEYTLTGSGLGSSKSGLGIELIYKMG